MHLAGNRREAAASLLFACLNIAGAGVGVPSLPDAPAPEADRFGRGHAESPT
jgi:hypothetical protein